MANCRMCKCEVEDGRQLCRECASLAAQKVMDTVAGLDLWKVIGTVGSQLLSLIDGVRVEKGNLMIDKDSKLGQIINKGKEFVEKVKKDNENNA